MIGQIKIREAVTEQDIAFFWEQLHIYHKRDIFPEPDDKDREYFLDDAQYRAGIEKSHSREQDRCYYLLFCRDETKIGFAMPVIYNTEDAKCFLMEFCVFPEFRGNGTGLQCARVFLSWANENGAKYAELNCDTAQRQRFWQRVGFIRNGADEWGIPLMILPPEENLPITVEVLKNSGIGSCGSWKMDICLKLVRICSRKKNRSHFPAQVQTAGLPSFSLSVASVPLVCAVL